MKKAAVIGCPVKHSLSPKLHGFWLEKYGVDGEYNKVEVLPEELEGFLKGLKEAGYQGVNITVPHKENAVQYMDELSDTAKRIGAVNTVVVKEDGGLFGDNTDAYGFIENIKENSDGFDFAEGRAVVLGAGGASRAVVVGLLDEGVPEILLLNRTREKDKKIKEEIGGNIIVGDWKDREKLLDGANLLVNTTVLGMDGQKELELNLEMLPKDALVTDIVYKPLKTKLLLGAKARGNQIVDGIGMLLYQAVPGFEYWFGVRPEVVDEQKGGVL